MIQLLALLAAVTLALGALGGLAAPLDTLALLRVPSAVVLLGTAFVFGGAVRLASLVFALVMLATCWKGHRQGEPSADLILYQKNVFHQNESPHALVADIIASDADVLTLQELSYETAIVKTELSGSYPHVHACTYRGWEIAVMSRLPFTGTGALCSQSRGLAAVEVLTVQGPVWVASTHIPWPWPFDGWDSGREFAELLAGLSGPIVVAGDFNTVPWAATVTRLARAAGAKVLGPVRGSLRVDPVRMVRGNDMTGAFDAALGPLAVPLPIDHVLAPGGQRSLRPGLGSDHRGVLARIVLSDTAR